MAAHSNVQATEMLARGLRAEFADTYDREIKGPEAQLSKVMELNLPSDKLSEIYGYFESAPHWARWDRGKEIARAAFRGRNFTVPNLDWGIAIDWHENDEQDDQSSSLVSRVRDAAIDAALLSERVFFQMLTGGTDNNLLPLVPNAPDGATLFAATAGGAARFGATGGNALSQSGVTSTGLIQQDFFNAYGQFRKFQDTQGQPLWPAEIQNRGITVIYNASNEQAFRSAFRQLFLDAGQSAPSNVAVDTSMKVDLWPTPRLTSNTWYMFLTGARKKALFRQVRQAPRDNMEDMLNSDISRRTGQKSMQWKARYGFGVALPYQCLSLS